MEVNIPDINLEESGREKIPDISSFIISASNLVLVPFGRAFLLGSPLMLEYVPVCRCYLYMVGFIWESGLKWIWPTLLSSKVR